MTNHHIHITGEKNTGKTQQPTPEQLLKRIQRLENEVGLEPPKTKQEKKIQEIEEKIDKLLKLESTESESITETEDEEQGQDMPGHKEVQEVREEKTETQQTSEQKIELPINYRDSDIEEREQAIITAIIENEKPLSYKEIAKEAFGEENVSTKKASYKKISEFVNKKPEIEVDKSQTINQVYLDTVDLSEDELENVDRDFEKKECPHCGEKFDSRGIRTHKLSCKNEDQHDLSNLQKRLLNKLNQRNFKGSHMLAAGLENHERSQIQPRLTEMGKKGLLESKRGYGYRLTDEGKKVQENIEISFDEETSSSKEYDLPERIEKAKEIWNDEEKPLTRSELAARLYDVEAENVKSGDSIYNKTESVIGKLRKRDEIVKVENNDPDSVSYILKDLHSEQEESSKSDEVMEMDWEEVKREAGVSDKDIAIVTLSFEKMVNRKGMDEIDYYDFEKHYTGEEKELRMFQKLFENPNLLEGIRNEVSPDKDWTWKKRTGQKSFGAKSWVINIE